MSVYESGFVEQRSGIGFLGGFALRMLKPPCQLRGRQRFTVSGKGSSKTFQSPGQQMPEHKFYRTATLMWQDQGEIGPVCVGWIVRRPERIPAGGSKHLVVPLWPIGKDRNRVGAPLEERCDGFQSDKGRNAMAGGSRHRRSVSVMRCGRTGAGIRAVAAWQ
jgi:hypothetical protein